MKTYKTILAILVFAMCFCSCEDLIDFLVPEELPEGALPGEFRISPDKKVHFSRGNLVYEISDGNFDPYFFDHQYDCQKPGPADPKILSHFIWGHSEALWDPDKYYYSDQFWDWGEMMVCWYGYRGANYCWYTLSKDEWTYLFDNQTYKFTTVCGQIGYAIAPDSFEGTISDEYKTPGEWKTAEDAGLVFLPMAGEVFSSGNINGVPFSEDTIIGGIGSYWTSTSLEGEDGKRDAYCICMYGNTVRPESYAKNRRISVRLVWGQH